MIPWDPCHPAEPQWALVDPRDLIRADEAPPPTPNNFCVDRGNSGLKVKVRFFVGKNVFFLGDQTWFELLT